MKSVYSLSDSHEAKIVKGAILYTLLTIGFFTLLYLIQRKNEIVHAWDYPSILAITAVNCMNILINVINKITLPAKEFRLYSDLQDNLFIEKTRISDDDIDFIQPMCYQTITTRSLYAYWIYLREPLLINGIITRKAFILAKFSDSGSTLISKLKKRGISNHKFKDLLHEKVFLKL